jgi:hypothetical protein
MKMRFIAVAALTLLAGPAQAFPVEAITSFFKLFKGGGTAAKEAATAATAGRSAAEGATAAKGAAVATGVEHLPASDAALRSSPLLHTAVEPKPNMAAEPTGKSARDVSAYKTLRDQAAKGDTKAMARMSSMTSSGKISDPGEPYQSYWTFQAARAHDQAAIKIAQTDCRNNESLRRTDMWYDSECSYHDGKLLYSGKLNTQNFLMRPSLSFPPRP